MAKRNWYLTNIPIYRYIISKIVFLMILMCYKHVGTYKIECMQFMKRKINKNKSIKK